jgi:hypothetical protein
MLYKFDLSNPLREENSSWPVKKVSYAFVGDPDYTWFKYFNAVLDGEGIPGIPYPIKLPRIDTPMVSSTGDIKNRLRIWATPEEVIEIADFLYACSKFASEKSESVALENQRAQEDAAAKIDEFYAEFSKVPGPPA